MKYILQEGHSLNEEDTLLVETPVGLRKQLLAQLQAVRKKDETNAASWKSLEELKNYVVNNTIPSTTKMKFDGFINKLKATISITPKTSLDRLIIDCELLISKIITTKPDADATAELEKNFKKYNPELSRKVEKIWKLVMSEVKDKTIRYADRIDNLANIVEKWPTNLNDPQIKPNVTACIDHLTNIINDSDKTINSAIFKQVEDIISSINHDLSDKRLDKDMNAENKKTKPKEIDWDTRYAQIMKNADPKQAQQLANNLLNEYYEKAWPNLDRDFFERLGDGWKQELGKLGFTEKTNPFVIFIRKLSKEHTNILRKLNRSNYGVIHNAFIKHDINQNDLDLQPNSALLISSLYEQSAENMARYLDVGGKLQVAKIIDDRGKLKPVVAIADQARQTVNDTTIAKIYRNKINIAKDKKLKVLNYLILTYAAESERDALCSAYKVDKDMAVKASEWANIQKALGPDAVNMGNLKTVLDTINGFEA